MKSALWTAALASLCLVSPAAFSQEPTSIVERDGEPDVVFSDHGDVAMIKAVGEARVSLPHFWERMDADDEMATDFMIKAGLPAIDGSLEHIWVDGLQLNEDDTVTGVLANEPFNLAGNLAYGDSVTFGQDEVTDWGYYDGEQLRGHFTTRVLANTMPIEDAAGVIAMLHEDPLP